MMEKSYDRILAKGLDLDYVQWKKCIGKKRRRLTMKTNESNDLISKMIFEIFRNIERFRYWIYLNFEGNSSITRYMSI